MRSMKSWQTPTADQVSRALALLARPEQELQNLFASIGEPFDERVYASLRRPSPLSRKNAPAPSVQGWRTRVSGHQLERTIEILRLAWSGERFSFAGRRWSFQDLRVTPDYSKRRSGCRLALPEHSRLSTGRFEGNTLDTGSIAKRPDSARELTV